MIADLPGRYRTLVKDFRIPPNPPKYREGNPEWPAWIEWNRKVGNEQVLATGFRLRILAEYYASNPTPELEAELKRWALEIANWDWNDGSSFSADDIAAESILHGLNLSYDLLAGRLEPEEKNRLVSAIIARADQAYRTQNPWPEGQQKEYNNHAWIIAHGYGESGILLLGEHPDAEKYAEYARMLFLGKFLPIHGTQGENNEGVPYWAYGLQFMIQYADLLRDSFGIDLYRHPFLAATSRFPLYCAVPQSPMISFADCGQPNHDSVGPVYQSTVALIAGRTGDPYAKYYAGTDPADAKPPVDLPGSIHYRSIGWTVFNTNLLDGRIAISWALRSGKYVGAHQQDDQNSFLLNVFGEKMAIDSGYYDFYGSRHFNEYSTQSFAHNTLLVDGLSQGSRRPGADGAIERFFANHRYGFVRGDGSSPLFYQGKLRHWKRSMLAAYPGIIVVHDRIEPENEVKIDWLFHASFPIVISGDNTFEVSGSKNKLRGQFLIPERPKLSVTDRFPVRPVDGHSTRELKDDEIVPEWHLKATMSMPGNKPSSILTVLETAAKTEPAIIRKLNPVNADGCKIVLPDKTLLIFFRTAPGVIKLENFETDAESGLIELKGKEVDDFLLIGATTLSAPGGREIFHSERVVDTAKRRAAPIRQLPPIEGLSGCEVEEYDGTHRYYYGIILPQNGVISIALPDGDWTLFCGKQMITGKKENGRHHFSAEFPASGKTVVLRSSI